MLEKRAGAQVEEPLRDSPGMLPVYILETHMLSPASMGLFSLERGSEPASSLRSRCHLLLWRGRWEDRCKGRSCCVGVFFLLRLLTCQG